MNKDSGYTCPKKNLHFALLTILATIKFMMQLYSVLLIVSSGGVLNDVQYTIFELKMSITMDTYSHVYSIVNFPLITVLIGVLYNIYIIVKYHRNKDKDDS